MFPYCFLLRDLHIRDLGPGLCITGIISDPVPLLFSRPGDQSPDRPGGQPNEIRRLANLPVTANGIANQQGRKFAMTLIGEPRGVPSDPPKVLSVGTHTQGRHHGVEHRRLFRNHATAGINHDPIDGWQLLAHPQECQELRRGTFSNRSRDGLRLNCLRQT